jgi:hypothetical protein
LTLSPEKTHITHVDDGFDLLGFRIVRAPWRGTKRLREVMHRIKTLTNRSTLLRWRPARAQRSVDRGRAGGAN